MAVARVCCQKIKMEKRARINIHNILRRKGLSMTENGFLIITSLP